MTSGGQAGWEKAAQPLPDIQGKALRQRQATSQATKNGLEAVSSEAKAKAEAKINVAEWVDSLKNRGRNKCMYTERELTTVYWFKMVVYIALFSLSLVW